MRETYQRCEQRVARIIEFVGAEDQRALLALEYKKRYQDAFSPQTLTNIDTSWRLFQRWCHEFGHSPELPISPVVMAEYVDYLGGKVKAHTIQTRLWGFGGMPSCRILPLSMPSSTRFDRPACG